MWLGSTRCSCGFSTIWGFTSLGRIEQQPVARSVNALWWSQVGQNLDLGRPWFTLLMIKIVKNKSSSVELSMGLL